MPNDKNSSTVDFLNNIESEVFKEEATDVPEGKEEEVDEKPLPFHQDPKIQKFIGKEVEKRLKDFKPAETQFRKDVEEINLPSSFIKLVGNDTEEKKQVLKDLSDYFGTLKGDARKEFLAEMQEQEQARIKEDNAVAQELASGFEEIEETFGVDLTSNTQSAQKLDNDFRNFIRRIAPKNEDGEVKAFPDLVAAFEEFQEKNKRPATRAKELASRGMTRSTDTATATPQGRSWKDVDRYFSKLENN